jgi:hypothetical protein
VEKRYWMGSVPGADDFGAEIADAFVDGKTVHGPWAIMTPASHRQHGVGLGQGRGQRYSRQADGRWLKIEG